MSRLRPDAKEFVYRPSTGGNRLNLNSRIDNIRSSANPNSITSSNPNPDLQQQQQQQRSVVQQPIPYVEHELVRLANEMNREIPLLRQRFEGGQALEQNMAPVVVDPVGLQRQILEPTNMLNQPEVFYQRIPEDRRDPIVEDEHVPYKAVLDEFKSTIEVIVNCPAQFGSALELLLLDFEPYFEDQMIMDYVATVIIDTGWDTNFHYLAAKLASEFDANSKYFRTALLKAVNNEFQGHLLDLCSFSLLISEFFSVFPSDFINILFNCLDKLFEDANRYDRIKIICKILKLNALKLESFNSVKYSNLINKLKTEKPKTSPSVQTFIDNTLLMIESEHSTVLNGDHDRESEQISSNGISRNEVANHDNSQQMINNDNNGASNSLFNMYGVSDVEDSGIGGVLYGPDSQPLTEEEVIFLNSAA